MAGMQGHSKGQGHNLRDLGCGPEVLRACSGPVQFHASDEAKNVLILPHADACRACGATLTPLKCLATELSPAVLSWGVSMGVGCTLVLWLVVESPGNAVSALWTWQGEETEDVRRKRRMLMEEGVRFTKAAKVGGQCL
eukprot:scaffold136689_cov21-Tisochrysis_lutea.AAC.1